MALNANQGICYLYNFNSYSDRVIKKYDTLNEYLHLYPTVIPDSQQLPVNFCEGDGVIRTNLTYRKNVATTGTPDYVIVTNSYGGIQSRWFVVDSVNKNNVTYSLTLKRDCVADFYDKILDAPTYIEKATLPLNSPFLFNSEDMTFNQIKQSETLLKDRTGCPWIIGFMAQQQPDRDSSTPQAYETQVKTNAYDVPDATYSSMSNYPYWNFLLSDPYNYTNNTKFKTFGIYNNPTTLSIQIAYTSGSETPSRNVVLTYLYTPAAGWVYYNNCVINNQQHTQPWRSAAFAYSGTLDDTKIANLANQILVLLNNNTNIATDCENYVVTYGTDIHSRADYEAFRSEAGKVIKTNNSATQASGEVYPASMYVVGTPTSVSSSIYGQIIDPVNDYLGMAYNGGLNHSSQLYTDLLSLFNANLSTLNLVYRGQYGVADIAQDGILAQVAMNDVGNGQITFTLDDDNKGLVDAPYRMFCMPYNDNVVKWLDNGGNYIVSNKGINMGIAQGIATTFSGTWLYDLQLVPFCPMVKSDKITINANNEVIINIQAMTMDKDYSRITNTGNNTISYILWCETSQVQNYQIPLTINKGATAIDRKVNNQCDIYRLSSPAYNSVFEFSAEMNNGVNGFDVDLAYKPYDSYIHINPNWGGLYIGENTADFNDARGLVFTGPFSLPQTTSAWMQYKLNNMNYQNSFDRQIENMNTMYEFDKEEAKWKQIAGVAQGGATGAAMGAMVGGGWGALAGAALGAGVSAWGAHKDQELMAGRHTETINYTQDQFNYNLQNIKAQAQTLSKVSSFTPNNKVFPVLEYYSCTEQEKDAFKLKLYYNGMKVGIISDIRSFLQPTPTYIKGQIIRLTINEENHMVEDIKNEINKGVFI